MPLLDGNIVFINNNNGGNAVVLMKHAGEIEQRTGKLHFTGFP